MTWTSDAGWTYPAKPENSADNHWRWRPLGLRVLLQWYDDATGEWTDEGAYKNEADVLGRIA